MGQHGPQPPQTLRPGVGTQGDTSYPQEVILSEAKNLGRGENMAKPSGILVGTAGVYYVASQLAARGFHAAVTHGNAPSVDILVGLRDGTSTVSLQVKTSSDALRTKGGEPNKVPYYYNWRMAERLALLNHPGLFFAFVDLKLDEFVNDQSEKQALPDVFILPSKEVHDVHEANAKENKKSAGWWWWQYSQELEQYKNAWKLLDDHLAGNVSQ